MTVKPLLNLRLWKSLSEGQQEAVIELDKFFEISNKGIELACSNFCRLPDIYNPLNISEMYLSRVDQYREWYDTCLREQLNPSVTMDIINLGRACSTIDKVRSVRKGTTAKNLKDCLTLYQELFLKD